MKILVVEDTRSSLAVLTELLQRRRATVIPAENGANALAAFTRERPDLVLLDVVLPDIDGYEVARRIRSQERSGHWTPIIFLSGQTQDADLEKGIAAGGDDYLFKPVSEVVLGAKIGAMQRIVQMRESLVALAKQLDQANQELKSLSSRDGLTGIANRRAFDETLEREWQRALRTGSELAMLLCDVDHFKRFNDSYGHQAGDECLRRVAAALRDSVARGTDAVARYGGEEFGIILADTGIGGALIVAEKIRHAVHLLAIPHQASATGTLTLSIGIACFVPTPQQKPEALLQAADRALYSAKHNGRDRVVRYDPSLDY